jgi:hypothetical protein
VAAPRPWRYADTDQFPLLDTCSFNPNLVGSTFSQTLTLRPKSPNVASGLHYTPPLDTLNTFDPFSLLPDIEGEPVPKQLLIKYCECPQSLVCVLLWLSNQDLERLAPWFCYLEDNPTDLTRRIAWLPFALEHKPFFYATLLTAAVHLNRKRRFRDPSALLWFKTETIRSANEKMSNPAEASSDEMIMVAMILLVFNVSIFC